MWLCIKKYLVENQVEISPIYFAWLKSDVNVNIYANVNIDVNIDVNIYANIDVTACLVWIEK